MPIRTFLDLPRNEAGLVEKFIGTAYDTVKVVSDNLDIIKAFPAEVETLQGLEANVNNSFEVAKAFITEQVAAASSSAADAAQSDANGRDNAAIALDQAEQAKNSASAALSSSQSAQASADQAETQASNYAGACAESAKQASVSAQEALDSKQLAEALIKTASDVAKTYPDTAQGLAGTTDGQYFNVAGSGDVYSTSYLNNKGAAVLQAAMPSYSFVDNSLKNKIDALSGSGKNLNLGAIDLDKPNLKLTPLDGTEHSSISFNDLWFLGTDSNNTGKKDLYLYNKVRDTIPVTLTEDDQFVSNWQNIKVNDKSSYDLAGFAGAFNTYNGKASPIASSTASLAAMNNVYNTEEIVGSNSYNEFSSVYTFLQGFTKLDGKDCVHAKEHYIGYDNHLLTPYTLDSTKRAEIVLGMSYYAHLFGTKEGEVDSDGRGAYLYSGITTPLPTSTLDYYGMPSTAKTNPFTAIYAASGFSGDSSISSGDKDGAGYGAYYGFLVGSDGGRIASSVYIDTGVRSKFQYGAGLFDWTDVGLVIKNPLGTTTASGAPQLSILTEQPVSISNNANNGGVGLFLLAPNVPTNPSKRIGISLGCPDYSGTSGWFIGRDTANSGLNDLFFWSNTAQANVLTLDDNLVNVNNKGSLTFNYKPIWHAGNMGSGSGLDADSVDGLHSSDLAKQSDNNNIWNTLNNDCLKTSVGMESGGLPILGLHMTSDLKLVIVYRDANGNVQSLTK